MFSNSIKVDELDKSLYSILQAWIAPVNMPPDSRICNECIPLLEQQPPGSIVKRQFGHVSVCLLCGISLLRTYIKLLSSGEERDMVISRMTYIPGNVLFSHIHRICRPCWRRVLYSIESAKKKKNLEQQSLDDFEVNQEMNVVPLPTLTLPNYKCVAATKRHCIFEGCLNSERFHLSMSIKQKLLMDYKLYTPKEARICAQHLKSNSWKKLQEQTTYNMFTSEQIQDMLFSLKWFGNDVTADQQD